MTAVVGAVLTVLTFVFVAYPLFRQQRYSQSSLAADRLQELNSRRETNDSLLRELESDHASGALSDEDYGHLEERYQRQAAAIVQEIDDVSAPRRRKSRSAVKPAQVEDEIEKQVLQLRQGKSAANQPASVEDEIENRVQQMRQGKARFCTQCGSAIKAGDRFCTKCGAKQKQ